MKNSLLDAIYKEFIPNGYVYVGIKTNGKGHYYDEKFYIFDNPCTDYKTLRLSNDIIQDMIVFHGVHSEEEMVDLIVNFILMQNTIFIESDNIKFYLI